MMERNERGKLVRKYFIEFEKEARRILPKETIDEITRTKMVEERVQALTHVIRVEDGVPMVSSLEVATRFGVMHEMVIDAIESLEVSGDFMAENYKKTTYQLVKSGSDGHREDRVMYLMTGDGFFMIGYCLTGETAWAWKIAFINTFSAMKAEIEVLRHVAKEQNEVVRDRDPEVAAAMMMMADAMKANTDFMMQILAQKTSPQKSSKSKRPKSVQDDPTATELYDKCNAQVRNIGGYMMLQSEDKVGYDEIWMLGSHIHIGHISSERERYRLHRMGRGQ